MRVSIININIMIKDAIGNCIINQARFLIRRGDQVEIYVMHHSQDVPEDIVPHIRVVNLSELIGRQIEHFNTSDLFIYHYPSRYSLVESIKGIDRGIVLFYYHNVTPPELWGSTIDRDELRKGQAGVGELSAFADLIVTDSAFNADQLVDDYACDRDRIRILPLAVPLDHFSPGPAEPELVSKYKLDGRRVILFVGRMAGNKRIDLLVEALPEIRRHVPNAVLLLAGDDQSNPALVENATRAKNRAQELGVYEQVIFTGLVDHPAPYYRLADVYATASLHEGFDVPLIEAMASGVPVVASRATAHPWVVGHAGLLVEPGNVADLAKNIVRVLTEDMLCGQLVQSGLERACDFSLKRYDIGLAKILYEVSGWIPGYFRPRGSASQASASAAEIATPIKSQLAPDLALLRNQVALLNSSADTMIRGYVVHSNMPVLGRLIAWVRQSMTSHLREPYVDPMFERQVAFNRQLVYLMGQIIEQLTVAAVAAPVSVPGAASAVSIEKKDLPEGPQEPQKLPSEFAGQLGRLETWLSLVASQLNLLTSQMPVSQRGDVSSSSASVAGNTHSKV